MLKKRKDKIKQLEKQIETHIAIAQEYKKEYLDVREDKEFIEARETVLNLIQEQQEQIKYHKKQKKYDDEFKSELLDNIRCLNLDKENLKAEIEKKDKIINLMSEKLIVIRDYLKSRVQSVDKCYKELVESYQTGFYVNVSSMNKKEKEVFINKRNCLLVQKHCYNEILEKLKN